MEVRNWVKYLVLRYNYLPLAYEFDPRVVQMYRDMESIRRRAIGILTEDSDEAEQYRQAIYRTLALHGFAYVRDMCVLGSIASKVLRSRITIDGATKEVSAKRRNNYKKFVSDIIVLNFGFVPPEYTFNIVVPWKKFKSKIVGATILSLALIQKLPVYSTRDSIVYVPEAEELVDFTMNVRQYAVKTVLEERPKKVMDLYALLHAYIKKEAENRGLKIMARLASWGALVESVIVPYYLRHYGFLRTDVTDVLLFELRY